MKFERSAGILLHPTSLPGNYGIGDLGPAAYTFIDKLKKAECKLWQVLPLGPTGYGDSPYQSFSAFAGNPLLISPELLVEDGLLNSNDIKTSVQIPDEKINYGEIILWKKDLLEKAYKNISRTSYAFQEKYTAFCDNNSAWLDEFAVFMTQKELQGGRPWVNWLDKAKRDPLKIVKNISKVEKKIIGKNKFIQFLFFKQWTSLRAHANDLGIKIIGDLPLYVAHDSADTWAHPELFKLDEFGQPKVVAGVPPDCFSPTGQLWGNPIYSWEDHKLILYQWWVERIKHHLNLVDIIRLDHFRGFSEYWEVPISERTAEHGCWVKGPGIELFRTFQQYLGKNSFLPFIAEDLGVITPDVNSLMKELKLPGMKILQFAFSDPYNSFLPHNFDQNCVAYTGTHDNDTSIGWFNSAPESDKSFAKEYLKSDGVNISWDLIRACWASVAVFAIVPMQDLLNLDSNARMNYPNRLGGNWDWRMDCSSFSEEIIQKLKKITDIYGRS